MNWNKKNTQKITSIEWTVNRNNTKSHNCTVWIVNRKTTQKQYLNRVNCEQNHTRHMEWSHYYKSKTSPRLDTYTNTLTAIKHLPKRGRVTNTDTRGCMNTKLTSALINTQTWINWNLLCRQNDSCTQNTRAWEIQFSTWNGSKHASRCDTHDGTAYPREVHRMMLFLISPSDGTERITFR